MTLLIDLRPHVLGNDVSSILLNCSVWEHDVVDLGVQNWVVAMPPLFFSITGFGWAEDSCLCLLVLMG